MYIYELGKYWLLYESWTSLCLLFLGLYGVIRGWRTLKKKIIKTVIWSTLLYGAETWTIRMEERRRLESCEMWLWRKMLGILWSDKISNEEVLRRVGEERILMEIIQRRQRTWIGHTLRHGDLIVVMSEGIIEGKRPPGRKPISMLDQIKDGAPNSHFKRRAMDRMLWGTNLPV